MRKQEFLTPWKVRQAPLWGVVVLGFTCNAIFNIFQFHQFSYASSKGGSELRALPFFVNFFIVKARW